MATQDDKPKRVVYRGNCHCKAFVYEAELPEITSGYACNCSICSKKAYLWAFPDEQFRFTIVKGDENTLRKYSFGPGKLTHSFCPTCATPVLGELNEKQERALNIRAIQGINAWDVEKIPYDGASLGSPYVPPEHKGPLPEPIEGHKLYTGSCHCGAVTLAFMTKPLDETFDEVTADCSCSICSRNGYFWTYPKKEQVVLHASNPDDLGKYSFGPRFLLIKTFCKICGVCMTNQHSMMTEEERIAKGAEPDGGFADFMKALHPVNLRVFHDVDVSKLKAPEYRDGTKFPPSYVNP
ncbi:glutathione-dependent formaldehyde-activating enzyme [Stachybotrys elegans]|uniref:Glutathione-dependent formaldehyde-activating enzyme n=1 Tax=Stachybotrys elegans TaxID=80388 RepID=A0A8K0WRW1_9HYPO|nr:glutathione-dependent formaldehyde-activating enzyme [Stachybotrys elegans]